MPSNENGKVVKQVKVGKKKVIIIFDDESKLEISPNTYTDFNLYPKKIIDNKTLKDIKRRDSFDKEYQYALNVVSKKDISEKALREKLLKRKAKEGDINEIIKSLKKYNLLNEEDIIDDYLAYADFKLYGENRIKEELYKKGITEENIDKIEFSYEKEINKAKSLLKKSEHKYSSSSFEDKKKHLYELLLRQGYSYDIASSLINNLEGYDKKEELSNLKNEYKKAITKYKNKYDGSELNEKVINYLLRKGYKYQDIKNIKGDI